MARRSWRTKFVRAGHREHCIESVARIAVGQSAQTACVPLRTRAGQRKHWLGQRTFLKAGCDARSSIHHDGYCPITRVFVTIAMAITRCGFMTAGVHGGLG